MVNPYFEEWWQLLHPGELPVYLRRLGRDDDPHNDDDDTWSMPSIASFRASYIDVALPQIFMSSCSI